MNISEIILNSMQELTGEIQTLSTKETVDDIFIVLDRSSKEKLSRVLTSGNVTRADQDIRIDNLTIRKEHRETFEKGQSHLVKKDSGYSFVPTARNPARFAAKLQTIVSLRLDVNTVIAICIKLGNIEFDLTNSKTEILDDIIIYSNVGLTLYPSEYKVSILED